MKLSLLILFLFLSGQALADLRLDIDMGDDDDEEASAEEEAEFDREFLTGEKWFYMDESGERNGPMFFEDMKSAFFKGKMNMFSRVWKPEWESWRMFKTIPGLRSYLKENLDVKQQLQLIAVDDHFVASEIRRAEATTRGGSGMLDSAMLCSKATALAEVIRRGVSKSLLKEILQEAISAETERVKMIKVKRALKFENNVLLKQQKEDEKPIRRELVQLIKALKKLKEKKVIEPEEDLGVWKTLLQHSAGEELFLLYLTAKENPAVLLEPGTFVAIVLLILFFIFKVFFMVVETLRTPLPTAPPARPKKEGGGEEKKSKAEGAGEERQKEEENGGKQKKRTQA